MKTTLIRGVPLAVQQDGWWLSGEVHRARPPVPGGAASANGLFRVILLAVLIALGDVLIWQVVPGVSLAAFAALLMLAGLISAPVRPAPRQVALIIGLTVLVLLPLIELVQPLSLLIASVGVSAGVGLIAGVRAPLLANAVVRLWPLGIDQSLRDARGLLLVPGDDMAARLHAAVRGWLMPLALGGLFLILLTEANPVMQSWLDSSLGSFEFEMPGLGRAVFWLCLAPVVWTGLSASRLRAPLSLPLSRRAAPYGPHREGMINAQSVTRGLALFNAIFAIQTGMDLLFLYGGVGLPDGVTYAEYAHRGAYPLLATALLAGSFALLTRRWTHQDPTLRIWLMIWVAQNVALVVSSLVRLDLYVVAYGLTHLRVHAAIWMAVVAVGLGLVIWQVWRGHENRWLLVRCAGLGAAVLYVSAFLSFDAIVARHNVNHQEPLDTVHLCHLGDAAQPYVELARQRAPYPICDAGRRQIALPVDWREWGFRNWRARRSLARVQAEALP